VALKDYEESRGKISRIQARLNQTVEQIRNAKALSDSGKRTEMARATLEARKQSKALRDEFVAEREARRESLERRLFGLTAPTPTELMVLRDSRDRAAALENEADAELKLKLANQAGDTFMAKAIAQVAATKGWREIVETYAETAPLGTRSALEQLADIPSGRNTRLVDNATFAIRGPREFDRASDGDLEYFVQQGEE
jgi:hypothetical protein